jgi:hypothetical protein
MRGSEQVAEGYYVLKSAGALVQIVQPYQIDHSYSDGSILKAGAHQIAPWGKSNLRPQEMLKLVYGNHIKPQLIYTARDFLMGGRLGVFKRVIADVRGKKQLILEPVIDPEMEDFLEQIDGVNLLRSAAFNLEFSHNAFVVPSLNAQKKVDRITAFDCTDVRAEVCRTRQPEKYHIHPDWANVRADQLQSLPAYDRLNPTRFGQFMMHVRDWTPGQKYYDCPPFWGTEQWTRVSNKIPLFHYNGLENGYNLKYHIKIPANYFDQFGPDPAKMRDAERKLVDSMNEMLSGVENVDKAFVSKFLIDPMTQKALPGWEIVPIENKMSDAAYDSVNTQANIAHTSGHGIDPSLAGIDTGSKLGGSGSEKRISYQLHIALRTPNKRKMLLDIFNTAARINGFDRELVYGIEDIDITTLAENKAGQESKTNAA